MKNIHVLPTDKPSRLWTNNLRRRLELDEFPESHPTNIAKHLYITSDEEIREGDYVYNTKYNNVRKYFLKVGTMTSLQQEDKKIILTTDQDLDGLQAVDDEFLEWFVNNPSCEEIEVKCYSKFNDGDFTDYKIIIPKKDPKKECIATKNMHLDAEIAYKSLPKQETLEEAGEKLYPNRESFLYRFQNIERLAFTAGAKWQQERSYTHEDMLKAAQYGYNFHKTTQFPEQEFEDSCVRNTQQWLTTFKKK